MPTSGAVYAQFDATTARYPSQGSFSSPLFWDEGLASSTDPACYAACQA
ncbi:hypothetical protein GGD55_005625 [Rhizobium giardinii]|uniref:Uncharacterized protein n=1 Tax=Rhizobium giardinii TaxID=56731 RepID=A0A7W8UGD2_9HYPH|nr:hypothetical protein [Rhizobium giardinii]